ncbi:MAG: hypothetical protein F6K47_01495 [Symploca sp. SIO2E6]|nr:hypothetical protein [Symploca sp. SIO2E6]
MVNPPLRQYCFWTEVQLLFITHYSLLITHYSLLITRYLLLVTYFPKP